MRNEALELPRDTGHQLVFYRWNADSSKQTKHTVDRKIMSWRFYNQWASKLTEAVIEGVWCACIALLKKYTTIDCGIVSYDGWNAEWNHRIQIKRF